MTFKSAVDSWFYLVIGLLAVAVLAPALPLFKQGQTAGLLGLALSALLAIGLPLWLLAATDYTVTDTQLLIRSGPFRWKVPRAGIRSIRPSRSLLSGPALSLNRLEIRYNSMGWVLVSPADREGFIAALGVPATPQQAPR